MNLSMYIFYNSYLTHRTGYLKRFLIRRASVLSSIVCEREKEEREKGLRPIHISNC